MLISLSLLAGGFAGAGFLAKEYNWKLIPFACVTGTLFLLYLLWGNFITIVLLSWAVALWGYLCTSWWWMVRPLGKKEWSELVKLVARYLYREFDIKFYATLKTTKKAPPVPENDQVAVIRTARDSEERFCVLDPLQLEPGAPNKGEATIVLDPDHRFQTFFGFGTALTEASVHVLLKLSSANQERVYDAYFKKGTGLGFNVGRLHMNSCDFSGGNWACREQPGGRFSMQRYEEGILQMAKRATQAAGGSLTLFASPWSPPAYMKDTGSMCRGGKLKPEYREEWAQHYVEFAKAMKEAGTPLWGFSVQNEPEAETAWENCLYSPEEERDFIRDHLGPALEKSELGLKLIAWDHNRDELFLRAHTIYSDPEAEKYVWGMGYHWYGDPRHEWWPDSAGMVCFDNVRKVHDLRPMKHLLVTETCQEVGPHIGDWTVGERYAESIINDFNNWCEGWVDWNMVLDHNGGPNHVGNECSAPIIADTKKDRLLFNPSYFYLGHFSRHIQPGAQRILCGTSRDALEATAWLNTDGTTALVVLNRSADLKDFCLVIKGKTARATALPHSITTYLLPASALK